MTDILPLPSRRPNLCRQLHANRPPIPDVPAIYFISPTLVNLRRVAQDAQQGLYDSFHLNVTSHLPRPLMEEFAGLLAQSGSGEIVEQVWDQYLDFIVPSPSLFSLLPRPLPADAPSPPPGEPAPNHLRPTYALLNDPSTTEEILSSEVDRIAGGLFSVLATTGQIPLVRCPRGNAAEMVGRKLDGMLREHLQTSARTGGPSGGLFGGGPGGDLGGLQRPCAYLLCQLFHRLAARLLTPSPFNLAAFQCLSSWTGMSTWSRCSVTPGHTRRSCTTCWT